MADTIQVTAGAGTTIATDDIGGVHYQRVKLALGSDGSAVDAVAGSGIVGTGVQRVTLATDVALPSGENTIGAVGGNTAVVDVTLSVTTTAHASGDIIADTQIVNSAVRKTNGTGVIQSIVVVDTDDQKAALSIYFLSANVSMGTENSSPSISDANSGNILGFVDVAVSDYKDLGGTAVAFKNVIIPIFAASGSDDIYVAVVNGSGTPTYTASGMTLRIGILQD